jgi:FkbM family methyltransferase
MTPLHKAIFVFLAHPSTNFKKISPYIASHASKHRRHVYEFFGSDSYSKTYSGHDDLLEILNFTDGFFVECGGYDGVAFDPTYYLEKCRNWKGIIVEPIPDMAATCKKNRRNSTVYQAALVSHSYAKDTIELINCNMMSVTHTTKYDIDDWVEKGEQAQHITAKKITVPAKTLDALLAEHGTIPKIDLLVIDVEGSEAEVLHGLTLEKYAPQHLLIEISPDASKTDISDIVGEKYNFIKKISDSDYLYKLKDTV